MPDNTYNMYACADDKHVDCGRVTVVGRSKLMVAIMMIVCMRAVHLPVRINVMAKNAVVAMYVAMALIWIKLMRIAMMAPMTMLMVVTVMNIATLGSGSWRLRWHLPYQYRTLRCATCTNYCAHTLANTWHMLCASVRYAATCSRFMPVRAVHASLYIGDVVRARVQATQGCLPAPSLMPPRLLLGRPAP